MRLKTLTPPYTGGIGQPGDQTHPLNLLGGVRHFSCLLARTLGDGDSRRGLGERGQGSEGGRPAGGTALGHRASSAGRFRPKSAFPAARAANSRWWFNTGFEGELDLQVTRRGSANSTGRC